MKCISILTDFPLDKQTHFCIVELLNNKLIMYMMDTEQELVEWIQVNSNAQYMVLNSQRMEIIHTIKLQ